MEEDEEEEEEEGFLYDHMQFIMNYFGISSSWCPLLLFALKSCPVF